MPATVNYTRHSQPKPMLQKNSQVHKSGFHLHPNLHPRRILSKKILPGGSISFLLGTLSSLYDTSSQATIEIPAEVISDYVAWEDLQAFEHDEFEKELQQKVNKKQEHEMMGAAVKRFSGRQRKSKQNLPGATPRPSRKLAILMEDLDAKSSKSQSPTSSTESHREIFNRGKGRTKNHKQRLVKITRPRTQWKNHSEDLEEKSSERKLHGSFNDSHVKTFTNLMVAKIVKRAHDKVSLTLKRTSSVTDLISGNNQKGPKSVARAQTATQVTPQLLAKRSIAMVIDDTDDAEDSRLTKRQIMNESNMIIDSDLESEERVGLLRQFRDRSPVTLPAQEIPVGKPVTPYFSTRTQAISYQNDSSESTTDDESESSATPLPRQPRPQAQPHKESYQSLDRFRQDDHFFQTQHRRYIKPSQRLKYSSDNEDENDDQTNDGPLPQLQFHKRLPQLGPSRNLENNDKDSYDYEEKNLSNDESLQGFQKKISKKAPPFKKNFVPSSIKPLHA
ncbi:hypothetical protein MMC29_001928 [Sticta canariensis]|nr:hypothetical protein [Sticta canariensis]